MSNIWKTLALGLGLSVSSLSFAADTTTTKGICDRSPQIQHVIMKDLSISNCADVTAEDLALMDGIWINYGYGDFKSATNKMKELKVNDLAGLVNLKTIDIEFSEISVVNKEMFKDLRSLKTWDFSHNQLKEVPEDLFTYTPNLTHVEFDTNEPFAQGTLPEKLFANLRYLEKLDLDELGLTYLPKKLFINNLYLRSVDLKKNKLTDVSGVFDHLRKVGVELGGNPIKRR